MTEAGDGPLVLCCHGFPELAYSWRHQITALADAGYHAVAPDQRGYGASSRPEQVAAYDIEHLTGDVLGIFDAFGVERAFVVGHDWGANVAWHTALRAPERVAGVVGMSVPFLPRPAAPPTQLLRMIFADVWFYILYFQAPGVAEADLGRDPSTTLRRLMCATSGGGAPVADPAVLVRDGQGMVARLPEPDRLPNWLSEADLSRYARAFSVTGFRGPLNWYRNIDRNWELTELLAEAKITVPALFVTGEHDVVRMMSPDSVMDGWVTDLRRTVIVEGAGHWVQQERPDVVNSALVAFLDSVNAD